VLAVRSERHRPLAGQPGGEPLVRFDEAVAADAHQDGAKFVKDILGSVGLIGDFRVQPDQRLAQMIFSENFMGLTCKVLLSKEMPAESGELAMAPSKTGSDGGVMRDATAESIADEGFDCIRFVEAHR